MALQGQKPSPTFHARNIEYASSPPYNPHDQFLSMQSSNSPILFLQTGQPIIAPIQPTWNQHHQHYSSWPITQTIPSFDQSKYLDHLMCGLSFTPYQTPNVNIPSISPYSNESVFQCQKLWNPWRDPLDQPSSKGDFKINIENTDDPNALVSAEENLSDFHPKPNKSVRKNDQFAPSVKSKKVNQEKIPRPMNSFMIFAKRNRSQIYQVYPHCDNRAVSKILSETWYSLESQMRKPYIDLANDMKCKHFQLYPEFKWKSTSENCKMEDESSAPINIKSSSSDNQSLSSMDSEDNIADTNGESMDYHKNDLKQFKLAPTPAQLGINRKKKISDDPAPSTTSSIGFQFNDVEKHNNLIDTCFQERFQALPLFDFNNYKSQGKSVISPKYLNVPIQYDGCKKRLASKRNLKTQQSKQMPKALVGQHFFGPDFNEMNVEGNFLRFTFFNEFV